MGQRAQRAPSPPRTTVAAAATVDAVVVMATAVVGLPFPSPMHESEK